jgi:hypothetical protein
MQRLLAETWRYQQLGAVATASASSSCEVDRRAGDRKVPRAPVQFCQGDPDERKYASPPPPICSDLVEVRATANKPERSLPKDSSEYMFLGRLVATLPEDQAPQDQPDRRLVQQGPNSPQAVVECNFWQRCPAPIQPSSEASSTLPVASSGGNASCTASPPQPALRKFGVSAASSRVLAAIAAGQSSKEDDYDLPPWPHEM